MTDPHEARPGQTGSTAEELFAVLWSELVAVLGTAAAATLVRRAAKRGATRSSELQSLRVVREGWEYQYTLPAGWADRKGADIPAFRELVIAELVPLLREFTGEIVLRRLGRVPALTELGFPVSEEK
jgi:hypothetical protein